MRAVGVAATGLLCAAGLAACADLKNGRIEVTLPDSDDLGPFLASLPDRLRDL